MRTYISLFSGAGVGCYGFKQNNFECIATSELMPVRVDIQRYNNKCKYDSGYISGDITQKSIKRKIFDEIEFWKQNEKIEDVDVVIATPPCQGMSTANYKKNDEQSRNSLVVEAIKIIKEIEPKIFIFENVRAFMHTICTDINGNNKKIGDAIDNNLSNLYNIHYKIINFKDYGIPSSRPRTIVIGTRKDLLNISPLNLFPFIKQEISLRDAIGDLEEISNFNNYSKDDIYHSFRNYDSYMREWIHDLKEGESAFSNSLDKKPYKIVNDKREILKSEHLGNKYRRLFWDKPCACVTTRNDQLASQDTIHPQADRVLSIREAMRVMSIPNDFKWTSDIIDEEFIENNRKEFLKKHELTIRRCIGEAVPTFIMYQIAKNINDMLDLEEFVYNKNKNFDIKIDNFYINSYMFEKKQAKNKETGTFYTSQSVVFDCLKSIKNERVKEIKILEPSVGGGNFLLPLINCLDNADKIIIDVVDIDKNALKLIKANIAKYNFSSDKVVINYYNCDFITIDLDESYDIIVGNPPYFKLGSSELNKYKSYIDVTSKNIYGLFLDKMYHMSKQIIMVIPKNFLMAPEFNLLREKYEHYDIVSIVDHGINGFKKVFIEIISIHFKERHNERILIENKRDSTKRQVNQKYIYHDKMWLIYRDDFFDKYIKSLQLDYFDYYRDRQITNKYLKDNGNYRVLRSKNILDDGKIVHIAGYDKYVDNTEQFVCSKYLNSKSIIFPNFTYNIRASILPKNTLVNGSIVIAFPKNRLDIKDINLNIYSTNEFRKYYAIVKNKSRFTINIDSNTIYYIGKYKGGIK